MSKEFVIHIGFSRNASTYIQKFVLPLYNSEDCYYLDRNSEEFSDMNEIFRAIIQYEPFDCDIDALKKAVEKATAHITQKKIILSDETLVGSMFESYKGGHKIAELLKAVFDNVKIITVFRRQDRFMESMYRMSVRMGYFHSLRKYVRYHNGAFNTSEERQTLADIQNRSKRRNYQRQRSRHSGRVRYAAW